jgi:uncharacterized membrane protein
VPPEGEVEISGAAVDCEGSESVRKVLFMVGVVLVILGAVLIVVPLIPSTSSFSASSASGGSNSSVAYNVYSASPVVPTYAKLSWSAPTTVYFIAITCTNDVSSSQLENDNSSQQNAACGTSDTVGNTSGTSGSYTFSIPAGGSLVFLAIQSGAPTNVSATLTGTEPLLGLIVLVIGIILLILGVVLKSKRQRSEPIAAPMPPPS